MAGTPQEMTDCSAAITIEVFPAPMARTRQPCRSSTGLGYMVASPEVLVLPKNATVPLMRTTSVQAEPQVIPTAPVPTDRAAGHPC